MRKLAIAFALLMITGAYETQSETRTTEPAKVTVETVISRLDSISVKAEKIKSLHTNLNRHEK